MLSLVALPYLAVPSCEAVAHRRPSIVVQTCTTQPVCPSNTCAQLPLTTSHTRAVKSSEAVRTRRPSGVSATAHTAPATRDPAANNRVQMGTGPNRRSGKQPNREQAQHNVQQSSFILLIRVQYAQQPRQRKEAAGQDHKTTFHIYAIMRAQNRANTAQTPHDLSRHDIVSMNCLTGDL